MTKQKTRKELERENYRLKYLLIICGFVTLVFVVSYVILGIVNNRLETQLSECQEQVDVWTLKVECDYNWEGYEKISYELVLNDYDEYLSLLKELEDEYCEVISDE